MFLTEKQGGSDVGATETVARREDGEWRLYGEKWFCSNVDAEGKLVLARREGAPEGTEGLSLFLVPHTKDGEPNDMLCRRLKDKLGTISVPTGEVELDGARGHLIGEAERGFKYMTEMLNLERLSNAVAACGIMGRGLLEAKVHAANREAFGSAIQEYPLMKEDLVDLSVDHEAATAYTFEAARAFAKREREDDDEAYRLLRALVPIAKLRTGRMAVDHASYCMEVLGGNGYVNDFVTHRLLRDAQVLPIWEGTSNVLSLDLLRAMDREDAHEPLLERIDELLDRADHPYLTDLAGRVRESYDDLAGSLATLAAEDGDYAQLKAKRLANYVFDVVTAALLVAEAQDRIDADGDARKALVARRFVDSNLRDRRGIADGERFALEHFDAVVRFAPVAPESLREPAPADD
jgi:acyl-CoA dehydrogenase